MCEKCDPKSDECVIFLDPLDKEFYLDVETFEWDKWEDDWVHCREYVSYCPYCGRKLKLREVN